MNGGERLSSVEARVDTLDARLNQLSTDVRDIRDALSKQRGFIAGFSAAFTLIWTVLLGLGAYLWGGKHP